ncbi:carbohydrate porin [Oceanobacter mangrovi]|uniref:carbohydrate porin n=1 Tax=Oceanobacter mangrovi TaxID=2862510 RepID=UPI001C8DB18E|nr:carbohydrate porin [Oceanobacter mangrovi]
MSLLLRTGSTASLSALAVFCSAEASEDTFIPFADIAVDNSQVVSGGVERGLTSRFLLDADLGFGYDQLMLQPDIQFIQHPSGLNEIRDAWVLTLSIEVNAFYGVTL